jgi:hypothetical protein
MHPEAAANVEPFIPSGPLLLASPKEFSVAYMTNMAKSTAGPVGPCALPSPSRRLPTPVAGVGIVPAGMH